jgi:predicted porin
VRKSFSAGFAVRILLSAVMTCAVCAPAAAQSSVQVYGRFYPYLNSEKASGATAIGTPVATLAATPAGASQVSNGIKGMAAGNSNLGFRGKEDLGRGLKAEFQVEGTVAVDDGSAFGFTWNRNTFVGLTGGFGSIKLGLMETVLKDYGDTVGMLGVGNGTPMSSSGIFRKVGFGTSNTSRFHERRANSIRYESPEFAGGFEVALQVATAEAPIAGVVTGTGSAKTFSYGLKYDKGPFYAAIAYEVHDNWYGGSFNSPTSRRNLTTAGVKAKDTAVQLTLEWRIDKAHKIEFDAIKKDYAENASIAGRFKNYNNIAYLLSWDARWNPQWRSAVQFVKSGAGSCTLVNTACSTDGLEGSKVTLGASYYLNRRTYIFGFVDKLTNGKSARYSANDFGAVSPGEDTRHLILGLSHGF